jgi:hypothetical protein
MMTWLIYISKLGKTIGGGGATHVLVGLVGVSGDTHGECDSDYDEAGPLGLGP